MPVLLPSECLGKCLKCAGALGIDFGAVLIKCKGNILCVAAKVAIVVGRRWLGEEGMFSVPPSCEACFLCANYYML